MLSFSERERERDHVFSNNTEYIFTGICVSCVKLHHSIVTAMVMCDFIAHGFSLDSIAYSPYIVAFCYCGFLSKSIIHNANANASRRKNT